MELTLFELGSVSVKGRWMIPECVECVDGFAQELCYGWELFDLGLSVLRSRKLRLTAVEVPPR
jgi:hypothetical protein